jgi:hypothetical protein
MKAGLLANIILGDSPHLKGLVRHYNLLVINPMGKITGFNQHFLHNSGKIETQVLNQNFTRVFDSEEGRAELSHAVKQALKGVPGSVSFHFPDSKMVFKGVILPVYDSGLTPSTLIIITKAEKNPEVEERELEDFWDLATQMMEEVGIGLYSEPPAEKMNTPRILFIEDKKGLVVKLFQHIVRKNKDSVVLAPNSDAAKWMAPEFKPQLVISSYDSLGSESLRDVSEEWKRQFNSSILFVSGSGKEIRIEDGWLDIHVKNQSDSVSKILELIQQFYW